ncbi:MAG: hypothetical protein HFH48_05855 [Lachnospiraceae bacterium]|nr:hypothetical protein [Lachnospiraceae bacterium]
MRQEEQEEIIRDPGEVVEEEIERPELQLTRREKRWVALGALKAALMIGSVYLVAGAVLIALMLLIWNHLA